MSRKVKRLQRRVCARVKGSNDRNSAIAKLAKLHLKVSNIQKYTIHKLTIYLPKNHSEVKIENLNIKAFLKSHKLASASADCVMYKFNRKLEYKTEKFN
jgi:putative transposase